MSIFRYGWLGCIYLRVSANGSLTVLTAVGKEILVALDAVRFLLTKDVSVTCQVEVAVEAREVPAMPVLVHGLGVLTRKYQLKFKNIRF